MARDDALSFRALWAATDRAARGQKRSVGVAAFLLERERELVVLREELLTGTWRPRPPTTLEVRDPKHRRISVPAFRDRVVHQALGAVLMPRHERRLIGDTYACRVGKGTHGAVRKGTAWARSHRWWLRVDVEKYFPCIDHVFVREQLAVDAPEAWLRELGDVVLRFGGGESLRRYQRDDDLFTPQTRRTGLPLGNLTSQLWANRYLDPVDHFVKDRLRFRAYLRYMDDLLFFHDDRARLVEVGRLVEERCAALRLRLHRWEVLPTRDGVPLFGYRALPDQLRLKRTTVARAERRLSHRLDAMEHGDLPRERFEASLQAVFGHWGHADSWRLRERTLRRLGIGFDVEDWARGPAGPPP
jgi:hypothetical protein